MGQTIEDLELEKEVEQQVQIEDFTQRAANMANIDSGTVNVSVSEEVKEGVEALTKADLLEIWCGRRPAHIPYGVFKSIQKAYVSINKERSRGTMHFVSNGFVVKDGDKDVIKYLPKGLTYKKPIENNKVKQEVES